MEHTAMKCGHTAQGKTIDGRPACLICNCFDAVTSEEELPNLDGRLAKCYYCKCTMPSSVDLTFFKYKHSESVDEFYCGCRGWD